MVKKLMVSVLLAQTVYGADPLLSELKEALLQAKRQKAATDAQLEADSWISPLTLSATAQKTKESGSDVIENKNVGVSWSQDIFRSGGIDALIQKARASGRVELIGIDMEQAGYLKNIYTYWAQARRDALMVKQDTLTLQNREIDLEIIKKQYEVGNKDITDLNRAILDQGWGAFRSMLTYKAGWTGAQLIAVPAHYTSQTCPCCGHVSADNRTTQARFACVQCGLENHADVVGAINILARGHRVLACGEPVQSDHSTKQEPTEATQGIFP